jgi:hypothetical protein
MIGERRGERRAQSRVRRADRREQRAESREQRAESRKQRAESREQRLEIREQRAESREQELTCISPRLALSCTVPPHLPSPLVTPVRCNGIMV